MFAERTEKDMFSKYTNVLAILTGITDKYETTSKGKQLLSDAISDPDSIYYKNYLHRILVKSG
ncbi:MAG: hypothetical protein ABI760_08995 [Ferruginibacter sp.]